MRNRLRDLMAGVSLPLVAFNTPDGGGGGGAGDPPKSPESILFPDENGEKKTDASAGDGDKSGEGDKGGAGDWKEYVPDPNKSDEENAAAKAEHDKTKPAEGDKKADDPLDQVPDDGKYELTMPEGVEVDQELLAAVAPSLQAKGYTRREAQELTDKFVELQTQREKTRLENWGKTVQGWADKAKTDQDIGGDKWDATVNASRRAVDKLGTPELREYLNASGGGNHPELIRFMAKVGAMISEDRPASGGAGGAGKPADPAHVLFPNDVPKGK